MTTVADIMTRNVRTLAPTDTVRRAAQSMGELNVGSIPVCNGQKLVGMVTDRDITLRGVAKGLDAEKTLLSDIMSKDVKWCFEDQPLDEVMETMAASQIRRLPVVSRDKDLVGIFSLGDLATKTDNEEVGSVLEDISEPATAK
ncbi:CBS domain-containing protein [Polaromonas sp.]|uniref:CBS domain-containing protein n=1 Tax=Polaromonas sp. TaxID=1869339 RepID=UPI00326746B4